MQSGKHSLQNPYDCEEAREKNSYIARFLVTQNIQMNTAQYADLLMKRLSCFQIFF